jgi:hypothetical protein
MQRDELLQKFYKLGGGGYGWGMEVNLLLWLSGEREEEASLRPFERITRHV